MCGLICLLDWFLLMLLGCFLIVRLPLWVCELVVLLLLFCLVGCLVCFCLIGVSLLFTNDLLLAVCLCCLGLLVLRWI